MQDAHWGIILLLEISCWCGKKIQRFPVILLLVMKLTAYLDCSVSYHWTRYLKGFLLVVSLIARYQLSQNPKTKT